MWDEINKQFNFKEVGEINAGCATGKIRLSNVRDPVPLQELVDMVRYFQKSFKKNNHITHFHIGSGSPFSSIWKIRTDWDPHPLRSQFCRRFISHRSFCII